MPYSKKFQVKYRLNAERLLDYLYSSQLDNVTRFFEAKNTKNSYSEIYQQTLCMRTETIFHCFFGIKILTTEQLIEQNDFSNTGKEFKKEKK